MAKRKVGQIKRIGNGNWMIRLRRRLPDGTVKSVSKNGFESRDKADEALKELIKEVNKKQDAPAPPPTKTFDQLFDAYLLLIRPNVREQSYDLYERTIRLHLRPKFGETAVTSLDAYTIEMFYVDLQQRLGGEMVFKIHNQLKAALKKARAWRWILENPMDDVKAPSRKTKPKEPTRKEQVKDTLTPAELNQFFAACPSDASRLQWLFFAATGTRAQEVLGATWDNVDLEKKEFYVRKVLVRVKGEKKLDKPKTVYSRRTIPLGGAVVEMLKEHKRRQDLHRLRLGDKYEDFNLIFPTSTGKPQSINNIGTKVRKIAEDAGIVAKDVTPHTFRRSFATLGRRLYQNRKAVTDVLGHATESFTDDVYVYTDDDDKREATETILNAILSCPAPMPQIMPQVQEMEATEAS